MDAESTEPRPAITYLMIYEDSRVSLGIFCLPARSRIPLHNHPGMTVLSRCVRRCAGERNGVLGRAVACSCRRRCRRRRISLLSGSAAQHTAAA
jgi:hypothetical protein